MHDTPYNPGYLHYGTITFRQRPVGIDCFLIVFVRDDGFPVPLEHILVYCQTAH